ncbi:unnamed protein product [Leptidea sinapis]|uniref:Uncharacterized protein n=1 Tax=Leptidea sinapis TaxID=189913 RepID=A0A5E4Q442_9NEOP|nr:unnamed protein product [Leptidea sinapis]
MKNFLHITVFAAILLICIVDSMPTSGSSNVQPFSNNLSQNQRPKRDSYYEHHSSSSSSSHSESSSHTKYWSSGQLAHNFIIVGTGHGNINHIHTG